MAKILTPHSDHDPKICIDIPEFYNNPFPTYSRLRNLAPVYLLETNNLYAISTYPAVKKAFQNSDIFSSAGTESALEPDWLEPELWRNFLFVNTDGPQQQEYRNIMRDALSNNISSGFKNSLISHSTQLINRLLIKRRFDFHAEFSSQFVIGAILNLTGLSEKQSIDDLDDYINVSATMFNSYISDSQKNKIRKVLSYQKKIYRELVSQRIKNPIENDFLSAMIQPSDKNNKLSVDQLVSALDLFVIASVFNPSHLLTNAIKLFIDKPQIMKTLKNDPVLLPNFINELMRFATPTHNIPRIVTKNITFDGTYIPKNSQVLLMVASANRDHNIFSDAEIFKLDRQNAKIHLSFGYGSHKCLGIHMTKLMLDISLKSFLNSVDTVFTTENEYKWSKSICMNYLKKLPIKAI